MKTICKNLICKKDYNPTSLKKDQTYRVETLCLKTFTIYHNDDNYFHVNETFLNAHFYTEQEIRNLKLQKLNENNS